MSAAAATPATPPSARLDAALSLARDWIRIGAGNVDDGTQRLADILRDPSGLAFTRELVDGVLRPTSMFTAAHGLQRAAADAPGSLPWHLRSALRIGAALAPVLPAPVIPVSRRMVRDAARDLVADSHPDALTSALARLRSDRTRISVVPLDAPIVGEMGAARAAEHLASLAMRDDVDVVSVSPGAFRAAYAPWAFDDAVDDTAARIRPLLERAATFGTTLSLDARTATELDFTVAVAVRLLADPELRTVPLGVGVPSTVPDTFAALRTVVAAAAARAERGGLPTRIRIVRGDRAAERATAQLHGWPSAAYDDETVASAAAIRLIEWLLRPERATHVRVAFGGHSVFHLAYAWALAGERDAAQMLSIELGRDEFSMHDAVTATTGAAVLQVPVADHAEFDAAVGYLDRRLQEAADADEGLAAMLRLAGNPELRADAELRFAEIVAKAEDATFPETPRRMQDRRNAPVPLVTDQPLHRPPASDDEYGLTEEVIGIAKASAGTDTTPIAATPEGLFFGGARFVETAVYQDQEDPGLALGAAGFRNDADTDPSLAGNRDWATGVIAAIPTAAASPLADGAAAGVEEAVAAAIGAAGAWGSRPAEDRAAVLRRVARELDARRASLIEAVAADTGAPFATADADVSRAIDFAAYYGSTARELDAVAGAVFIPARVTAVLPPVGGAFVAVAEASLVAFAAGSAVVIGSAPRLRATLRVFRDALVAAGLPGALLGIAALEDEQDRRDLVTHEGVDRVQVTGTADTVAQVLASRPGADVQGRVAGRNVAIVMPSADVDAVVSDLVASAFLSAGRPEAISAVILVGAIGRSRQLSRQLLDAAQSLTVAFPEDPRAQVGPVAADGWRPEEPADGERWLVEPRNVEGNLWTPGIVLGVHAESRYSRAEPAGPVLGIMAASTLNEALQLHERVSGGVAASLHTRSGKDLDTWLHRVSAGSLFVNRAPTGAVAQRRPVGGWGAGTVGAAPHAGGPNAVVSAGRWRSAGMGRSSSTLHLRGLDSRIVTLIEAAQPDLDYTSFDWLRRAALSDAVAWDREFGRVRDVTGIEVERNLLRYRNVPVAIRAGEGATLAQIVRVVLAAIRTGTDFSLSVASGVPSGFRHALGDAGIGVYVETDDEWRDRLLASAPERVRLIGATAADHRDTAAAVPLTAWFDGAVTLSGRLELLAFLREQSVTISAHRYGVPDRWSEAVI